MDNAGRVTLPCTGIPSRGYFKVLWIAHDPSATQHWQNKIILRNYYFLYLFINITFVTIQLLVLSLEIIFCK